MKGVQTVKKHNETWMKLLFFDKYSTILNFILQFYDKFEPLNSQR